MLEILQYITSGFWVFAGCFMILALLVHGVVSFVGRLRGVSEYSSICPRCRYNQSTGKTDKEEEKDDDLSISIG